MLSLEGIDVIHTPFRAPKANAYAERWERSVREACLDHFLILNENHLRHVLTEYGEYYNYDRPHQGLGQRFPVSVTRPEWSTKGPIVRQDVFGDTSSTITTGSLHLRFLAMDRIFTPYKIIQS
jgi:putative transposase